MQGDINCKNNHHLNLFQRLLLVLAIWGPALLLMFFWTAPAMQRGLLIAALGEEARFPIWWSQDVVCLSYVVITWALFVYSRPIGFFILYGVLIVLLLLNMLLLIGVVGAAEQRFFVSLPASVKNFAAGVPLSAGDSGDTILVLSKEATVYNYQA